MSSGLPSYLLILFFTIFGVLIGILVGFFLAYRWLSRLLNLKIKENNLSGSSPLDEKKYYYYK